MANPLVERLMQMASDAWQGPQTLAGLAYGAAKTGKLPYHSMDPEGNREFRFDVEGEDPLTMGSVILGPKNMRPDHLAHERVHTRQSRRTGPAYIPLRVLGDVMSKHDTGDPYYGHPFEDEAYLETAGTNDLQNYLAMKAAYRNAKGKK